MVGAAGVHHHRAHDAWAVHHLDHRLHLVRILRGRILRGRGFAGHESTGCELTGRAAASPAARVTS
ncbi:hypothetical protein GCM10027586_08230 [Kineococcus gypseus]